MTPDEVADVLEASGQAYAGTLRSLPPPAATWHPADGEWCVNECVGHIIEAEKRAFAGRIRIILGADNPELESWDQAAVEKARRDCERRPDELLREFEPLRRDTLELIRSLSRVMNRARQDAITTEIMEIVGGAEALQSDEGHDDEHERFDFGGVRAALTASHTRH